MIEQHEGLEFTLQEGVPQGGCISPLLYSIFTIDLSRPINGDAIYIQFADDITQIIPATYKNKITQAKETALEINSIKQYEK